MIGIHTDPDDAVEEINALMRVHSAVKKRWKINDVVIMGDLNADCKYASDRKRSHFKLRSSTFTWLIDDNVDTTTSKTDCAYDRCACDLIVDRFKAKFHYAILVADRSEAGRRLAASWNLAYHLAR